MSLTKITANQKHMLDLLALHPQGASAARLRPITGWNMTLSSLMTAHKPYVQKQMKAIHGDTEQTAVYSLTPQGIARQQNRPFVNPTKHVTAQENLGRLLHHTAEILESHDAMIIETAQWDLTCYLSKVVAPYFHKKPRRGDIQRIIDHMRLA